MTKLTLAEIIKEYPLDKIYQGWHFKLDEITNGYWMVEGIDIYGHIVSRMGDNLDELIMLCKNDIMEIMKNKTL